MRSVSLFTILLLCLAILIVDIVAFYWLQSITRLLTSNILKLAINTLFWIFTIGLITSIIVLKVRLDDINPLRKQLIISSFYGLTVSSFVPKLIFVIVISILYFTNHIFSETESMIIIPVVGLFSGFLPFFIIAYAVMKSIYNFKVHHLKVSFESLPKALDGLRIVQISDIHLGSFNYRYNILERAVRLINHQHPDLIFFTGDLVNNYSWELRGWEKVFKELNATIGKYAVLGNHDYGDYSEWPSVDEKEANFNEIKQFFKDIDFKLLLNLSDTIEINGEKIEILGVENWGNPPFKQYGDLNKTLKSSSIESFKILLSHDPTHWNDEVINSTDIALTFSGHTHGMQAAFQYKNLKWSPIKYKYRHWAGLYQHNDQYLYVNRGLGWMGFPGRLGMRPEITLMELKARS
ncbi:MAG: metallophosphoesterase [Bacteroidia bacterium]|nr:metallophosphoesterase [Bacteroidia bacterium]NND11168.1 metallophosphoesterase [Flavobacteriaceae bacterium]NNK28301.1 metallophosphoesterase [Flavobacteriaceae bacterium]RZV64358.1 MAG: metallophosphoesterase [Flavobacteriaceae bacterium]RZW45154.1 MAG: metallophosphoesterase [Flavobacteriaceae bacterium]